MGVNSISWPTLQLAWHIKKAKRICSVEVSFLSTARQYFPNPCWNSEVFVWGTLFVIGHLIFWQADITHSSTLLLRTVWHRAAVSVLSQCCAACLHMTVLPDTTTVISPSDQYNWQWWEGLQRPCGRSNLVVPHKQPLSKHQTKEIIVDFMRENHTPISINGTLLKLLRASRFLAQISRDWGPPRTVNFYNGSQQRTRWHLHGLL